VKDGGLRRTLSSGRALRGPVGLILLRHEFSSSSACCDGATTWTSRQGFDDRSDQA
jgi:hypothetical protein